MENTSGFYKLQDNQLIYAPNGIMHSDYDLIAEKHLEYQYPAHGWTWFYSEEDAKQFFNIQDNSNAETIVTNKEKLVIATITNGVLDLDLSDGNFFLCNLNSNILEIKINKAPFTSNIGINFTLVFTADGTPRSIIWPDDFRWPEEKPPEISSINGKQDVFSFMSINNGNGWLAYSRGQGY